MVSDEMLMLQFQAGSRESIEELFGRYRDSLHSFYRRRLRSRERAEDLAQETWIVILRGIERYQPRALFRTYLYGIALKKLAGEIRTSIREKASPVIADSAGNSSQPECECWIREALEKLPEIDREMILLREYEQLSYQEIAELLNIPLNTVRSRLFRARLALKQFLEPDSSAVVAQGSK